MIDNKHIQKIIALLLCLALLACGGMVYAAQGASAQDPAYQNTLFGEEPVRIDIQADPQAWQDMLQNATEKIYVAAEVTVGGEVFSSVGVRPKGNSSLQQVASQKDSQRYSLQLNFDYYVKGQTCFGLDVFSLNNLVGDSTYMKDAIAYDLMDYLGVPTPLVNYAEVTVNGEPYGFFLLLERYEKSFLDREYQTSQGQLYNVKMTMGAPNAQAQEAPQDEMPQGQVPKGQVPQERGGMGGGGGDLIYTGDDTESYSAIFDNAVFSKVSDQDKQRVLTALENLNAGTNLEQYFDVDEILRYLAAHTALVNLDSYSTNMAQNYYIYEREGRLSILPWDYGLALGGFQSKDASEVVNFSIDTPVSGVALAERPLIDQLLQVPEYKEKYHAYLSEIVEGYFDSGRFAEKVAALDQKIADYVREDATAFTSYAEYQASLPVLLQLGTLRAESLRGQLAGTIPATTQGQAENPQALVDASEVDLSALGSMMGGGPEGGARQGPPGGDMPDRALMQKIMPILQQSGGELTPEIQEQLLALGLTQAQIEEFSAGGGRPLGGAPPQTGQSPQPVSPGSLTGLLLCLGALGGGLVFLARARKNY